MDLLGHERQMAQLQGDIAADNVSHAYLFVGPPHIGKFTAARAFAKELLLSDVPHEDREAIGHQIDRLLHPDLLVLDKLWMEDRQEDWEDIARFSNIPQEHRKKAGAKTDRISIDDIRAIQERIHDTASGRYRCVCIRSMERMDDPPANALLKILEEPPPGRVFLLTAASTEALLPTVVSRCRVLHFTPLGHASMEALLRDADPEDAQFVLHVAQGAPGLAKGLLADPEQMRAEKLLHSQANAFWRSATVSERLHLLEPVLERGDRADRFLLHLALALREERPLSLPRARAFRTFTAGLATNAQRGLLATQFALHAG